MSEIFKKTDEIEKSLASTWWVTRYCDKFVVGAICMDIYCVFSEIFPICSGSAWTLEWAQSQHTYTCKGCAFPFARLIDDRAFAKPSLAHSVISWLCHFDNSVLPTHIELTGLLITAGRIHFVVMGHIILLVSSSLDQSFLYHGIVADVSYGAGRASISQSIDVWEGTKGLFLTTSSVLHVIHFDNDRN